MARKLASFLFLVALGCGEVVPAEIRDSGGENPSCDSNADCGGDAPVCDPVTSECRGCQESPECEGNAAGDFCESGSGQCVACLVNTDCGDMTCDQESYQCRDCMTHADCDSDVCGGAGACVAENRVLYVDRDSNSPGPDCTREAPCATTSQATLLLSDEQDWMRVLGSDTPYQEFAVVTHQDAKICAAGAVFDLDGFVGANNEFFRVEPGGGAMILGGTFANSTAAAMSCGTSGAEQARLTVRGATFDTIAGAISGSGCNIEITDSLIRGVTDTAISLVEEISVSEVVVARNRIVDGDAGAIDVNGARLVVESNLIARNLQSASLLVYRVVDLGGDLEVIVVNNTIHSNGTEVSADELESTAFWCAGVDDPPIIANNIVWSNDLSNVFIECFGTDVVTNILDLEEAQQPNYPGNTFLPPLLENPGGDDFRPRPISPAIDKANPTFTPDLDIDRNRRDVGDGPDIGAFERQ